MVDAGFEPGTSAPEVWRAMIKTIYVVDSDLKLQLFTIKQIKIKSSYLRYSRLRMKQSTVDFFSKTNSFTFESTCINYFRLQKYPDA